MPEEQSEDDIGLEHLRQIAEQGIKATRSALCNRRQCEGVAMALSNLVSYIGCVSLFFSRESRRIPSLRSVLGELAGSVAAARRLASDYANSKQWLPIALASQENPLGFLAAVEEIQRYIRMMIHVLGSSEIIHDLSTKCEVDNAVVLKFLQEAAKRDRIQLKAIIEEEMKYARFSKTRKLRCSKLLCKLDSGSSQEEVFRIEDKELEVFRREKPLGQGNAGIIYKGMYLGIPVAVKEATTDDNHLRNERCVMVGLGASHPNIVRIFGVLEDGDSTYLVMELMEKNLHEFIKMRKLDFMEKLDILLQIASGVLFLHQNDVCYRDLKPQNILVKVEHRICIKLADFGHSKSGFRSHILHTVPVGTLSYMAPEVLLNDNGDENNYTKKTDTFSFAIAAAEILTGSLHFNDVRRPDLYNLYKRGKRPRLPENCPPRLKNLLERCWMFQAHGRPSFNEIYSELWLVKEEKLAGSSITVLPPSPVVQLHRAHTHTPESPATPPNVPIRRTVSSWSSQEHFESSSSSLAPDTEQPVEVPDTTPSEAHESLDCSSPEREHTPARATMGQYLQVEVSSNGNPRPPVPRVSSAGNLQQRHRQVSPTLSLQVLEIHRGVPSPASSSSTTQRSSFGSSSPNTPRMTPGIFDLVIRGECKVGSKLTAAWKLGVGSHFCVVQWGRCCDSREPEFLYKHRDAVTSSEHVLSPDDFGARMCIKCLPCAGDLLTGEPAIFTCETPVSLDHKAQMKMNSFLGQGLARFHVKIGNQVIAGRFELSTTGYYLWWSMSSTKNFRERYAAEGVGIRVCNEDPKACELTCSAGKTYKLRFEDDYRRSLAVLTMRHFMQAYS